MLFALKKFISFFIQPEGIVISLGLMGYYFLLKNKLIRAKILLSMSVCAFFVFSYPPVSNILISSLENQYPVFDITQLQYPSLYTTHTKIMFVCVLGGSHNNDVSQPISSRLGGKSIKRIVEGILIYEKLNNKNAKLIFTGGKMTKHKTSIAKMASNFAIKLGIDPDNIILGEQARDTQDEVLFVRSIVGIKPVVVVSSASHLPRVMQLFNASDVNAIPAPTDFLRDLSPSYFSIPNIRTLDISQVAIHEYLGILWLKFMQIWNNR